MDVNVNFRRFFDTFFDMVVVATLDGHVLFSNESLKRNLGYDDEDLEAMHVLDLNPPDMRGEAEQIFAAILRGERNSCPLPVITRSGTLTPVETRVWSGEWSGIKCIFGVMKDLGAEQESQQRFERVFRHNPSLMALSTIPERRFFDVNDAFLDTLGYAREEVIGKSADDLHLFARTEHEAEVIRRLREDRRIADFELQARCKDGTSLDGLFSAEIINSQGRQYLLSVTVDITDRKQMEAALREREANFRVFFDTLDDLVVVSTPEGRILFTNSSLQRKLGYEPEELAAMHVLDLHAKDNREEARSIFLAMSRSERDTCPLPLCSKGGLCIPVETRVFAGQWNRQNCIFGISKDLSAEQEAHQKFERIFRNNPALMAVSTLDGRFVDVNEAFLAVLGYSRGEVLGKTSKELGIAVQREAQGEAADTLKSAGHIADVELQVRRKDGTLLDGLFSGELIRSQGREYFLTVMNDITERKRAEAELRRLNETFEVQVAEQVTRNMALERTLIHQSRLAAVGQMLSNIAHQWRQPLNALGIALSNIQDAYRFGELDETSLAQSLADADRLIQKMSSTINDFRTFFLPDKEMVCFCLREQVAAAVALVESSFRHDNIAIMVHGTNDVTLRGVPNEYSQVLLNLLANCRDAIVAGRVSPGFIEIQIAEDGDEAILNVRDNGGGIPPDVLSRVFEPYFSTKPQGSGIGLYMSQMIIERRMGGRLEVLNADNGAEVRIVTPIASV